MSKNGKWQMLYPKNFFCDDKKKLASGDKNKI